MRAAHETLAVIADLRATGAAILLIEQNAALVRSVADQAMVMNGGSIVAIGTPRCLVGDPRLNIGAAPRGTRPLQEKRP